MLDISRKSPLTFLLLVPTEKASFPGKRPDKPTKKSKSYTIQLPVCKGCAGADPSACPFVFLATCTKTSHKDFPVRYGHERFKITGCPACLEEMREEKNDGWEFVAL